MESQTLVAYPIVEDVPVLVHFLRAVFGAVQKVSGVGSAGGYHAELQIGDTRLMAGGGGAEVAWTGDARPMAFHIYVPDTDATYRLALANGARSLQEPADQEWGERTANIQDPSGNCWYIATFKGENYYSEGAPTVQPFLQPERAIPVIEFLAAAFGAVELGRAVGDDGALLHTTLKIGNSAVELIDATGIYQPMPGMFYVGVADVAAAYRKAIAAGAESISKPGDPSRPDGSGIVLDVADNIWYIGAPVS